MSSGKPPAGAPIRVLVVQPMVPFYRLAFFSTLAASPLFSLTLAHGDPVPGTGLRTIQDVPGARVVQLTNWYVLNSERFVYQKGWLRAFRSRPAVIVADFNPRNITTLLLLFAAKLTRRGFVWWGHGIGPRSVNHRWIMRVRLALARVADGTIFYDDAQRAQFVQAGLDASKAYVAQNSIDVASARQLVERKPRNQRDNIVCLGRLMPRKKVSLLLEAFATALPRFKYDQTLTIIGDGPERERLEELARNLGIAARTRFLGTVDDEPTLASHMNRSWVSVSPGAAGLNLVHSAVYGIPLVLPPNDAHGPEISLVQEGVNAVHFRLDDASDLARRLLALETDHELWNRLSEGSAAAVTPRFGTAEMVRTFERAVMNASRRGRSRHT